MNAVRYISNRDFFFRPLRKKRLKDVTAHLAVQPADATDRPAPANCQICHVERLRRVIRILAAKRK